MSAAEQAKDDILETGLEILLKMYEKMREDLERRLNGEEENDLLNPYEKFEMMMDHVIENSEEEEVVELAKALKEDPENGMKVFELMNDKATLIGLKDAKDQSIEYVKALDLVSKKNLESDTPKLNLQKELDTAKGVQQAKDLILDTKIQQLERKNYSSLDNIKDERIKNFTRLANDFDNVIEEPKNKEKLKQVYDKIVNVTKLKKQNEIESTKQKVDDKEKQQKEKDELQKEKDQQQKEIKKERKREIEMER
ncbi:hypothetical protein [Exiguobacterium sp. BG5(2022)]|uniref:hypothetical protein n=1 Tax=Exiguobacterium sp. BG5(2022) TaxID=2962595 RepID=UPI00288118FB|nr:hypothetical protein [Exiguobacterium sp. BG5(2022)]MDT0193668.1 hypothetical protein [Exiguobacterium sp. BG5(2022)]